MSSRVEVEDAVLLPYKDKGRICGHVNKMLHVPVFLFMVQESKCSQLRLLTLA